MMVLTMAAALAASKGFPVMDSGCSKLGPYKMSEQHIANADEAVRFVEEYFRRDIDPSKTTDESDRTEAASMNAKVKVTISSVGTYEGVKLKKAMAAWYFSLVDGFMGKTSALVFSERKGKIEPLYFVSSCHYNGPEIVYTKTKHGSYLMDKAITEDTGTGFAPIFWRISGGRIEKTNIDSALVNETAKILSESKLDSLTISSGFDIKSLKYTGKSRIAGDCMACYSGPRVTITLDPKNGEYTATSTVEKVETKGGKYE